MLVKINDELIINTDHVVKITKIQSGVRIYFSAGQDENIAVSRETVDSMMSKIWREQGE